MKVYVVQVYDTVEYAGTSKKDAIAIVRGGGWVQVWKKGKLVGHLRFVFNKKKWELV